METVAVVGVGLIGASFGLALRRAGFNGRILGVSSPAAIQAGLAVGAISEEASLQKAAEAADLIYLAQTVDRILDTLPALGSLLQRPCLVTDAGSTKAAIVEKASECLPAGVFLGGHPMAGKEQRGAEAADGTLFRHRPYILTPVGEFTPKMREFQSWVEDIGSRTVVMSPAEHDNVVALTSHLPQLLSTAISITLAEQGNSRIFEAFGPGLLDMTRLALSSPVVWNSVLNTNRQEVIKAIGEFQTRLGMLSARLQSEVNVDDLFAIAQKFGRSIREVSDS
jgi:prephenate dehydrogenase